MTYIELFSQAVLAAALILVVIVVINKPRKLDWLLALPKGFMLRVRTSK